MPAVYGPIIAIPSPAERWTDSGPGCSGVSQRHPWPRRQHNKVALTGRSGINKANIADRSPITHRASSSSRDFRKPSATKRTLTVSAKLAINKQTKKNVLDHRMSIFFLVSVAWNVFPPERISALAFPMSVRHFSTTMPFRIKCGAPAVPKRFARRSESGRLEHARSIHLEPGAPQLPLHLFKQC